ncbi:uncharacterized protein LOC141631043 [Silene latifolia]|uniref:uncharacterized protein LOC141631043 n=1 Tax=Silene latifolia TaxID=37657 RepID=UPI003D76CBA2
MSVDLGNHPSYTWRRILEARDMLRSGWRVRIGDGLTTHVWQDAWVLGTQTVMGYENMVVADLLDAHGGGWRHELVDTLSLGFERGRRALIGLVILGFGWCLYDQIGLSTLGGLWKISVWPRVKLFFWQLCSEALATRANIASRVRGKCALCSFCNFGLESSLHLFHDCVIAKRVWEGLGLEDEEVEGGGGVRDWVEAKWRELVVFESREVDHWSVIRRTYDVMEEIEGGGFQWERRRVKGLSSDEQVVRKVWSAPLEGFVKINVDAGVKEGEGVSLGVMCRDEHCKVMWGISSVLLQDWDPLLAEAVTVFEGVSEAVQRGHAKVIVESNCLSVIEALKKKSRGRSVLSLVFDDINFV